MAARLRKTVLWALVALLVVLAASAGKLFHELLQKDIAFLIRDAEARDSLVVAWAARKVLDTVRPTESDIAKLNRDAGARHIAQLRDPDLAERMFGRFAALGLELEAKDAAGEWTALQMVVIENDLTAARFLIRHGAELRLPDEGGRDLLALVATLRERLPDQDYGPMNSLLQEVLAARQKQ